MKRHELQEIQNMDDARVSMTLDCDPSASMAAKIEQAKQWLGPRYLLAEKGKSRDQSRINQVS